MKHGIADAHNKKHDNQNNIMWGKPNQTHDYCCNGGSQNDHVPDFEIIGNNSYKGIKQ